MIDPEVAHEAIALLGSAAAMLIEDAHPLLLAAPAGGDAAVAHAAALAALGADLSALGAAAAVLARHASSAPDGAPDAA